MNRVLILNTSTHENLNTFLDIFELSKPVDLIGSQISYNINTNYYNTSVSLLVDETNDLKTYINELLTLPDSKLLRDSLQGIVILSDSIIEKDVMNDVDVLQELIDKLIQEQVGDTNEHDTNQDTDENDEEDEYVDPFWNGFIIDVKFHDPIEHINEVYEFNQNVELIWFKRLQENEYKEKLGIDRILQVFETHEWKELDVQDNKDTLQDEQADDEDIDLIQIFQDLKQAKLDIANLSNQDKHDYAMKIISKYSL